MVSREAQKSDQKIAKNFHLTPNPESGYVLLLKLLHPIKIRKKTPGV